MLHERCCTALRFTLDRGCAYVVGPPPVRHLPIPNPELAMTEAADPIVIASYARTPMGSFQGALSPVKSTDLGAAAVKAAMERAGVAGEQVQQIIMGCVLPAG